MSAPAQTDASASAPVDAGLRRGVMSGPELAAQAIANIAPSAVIAFTAAGIYLGAGNGTMLSFVLATLVILAVGYCVAVFAKRHASAGSNCRRRSSTAPTPSPHCSPSPVPAAKMLDT